MCDKFLLIMYESHPKTFRPRHIRQHYFPESIHQWHLTLCSSEFPQNQMPKGPTFTNTATDWKIGVLHCHSKSFPFSTLWCQKLQWCHIRSRLIWVGEECMFHWCIDCGKCLICWGQKLLGWLSYLIVPSPKLLRNCCSSN